MILQLEIVLIATAALPTLAAIGVLLTFGSGNASSDLESHERRNAKQLNPTFRRRRLSFALGQMGFLSGAVSSAILAGLLAQQTDPELQSVHVSLLTWLSFSTPQSPSLTFGLEATWIKASLISLVGWLAMIAVWNVRAQSKERIFDDTLLATSWLYAAGTVFAFAPNTPQALLGWGAVSLLAGTLMRQSHQQVRSLPNDTERAFPYPNLPQPNAVFEGKWRRRLQVVGSSVAFLERFFVDRIWLPITNTFPNWLGEQAEVIENSSDSVQLVVTVLGAFAILLTWLC